MYTAEEVSAALQEVDLVGAMREAFGKCPDCNTPLVAGHWLKWCESRTCRWVGPK